jgi:hypothetical protein
MGYEILARGVEGTSNLKEGKKGRHLVEAGTSQKSNSATTNTRKVVENTKEIG